MQNYGSKYFAHWPLYSPTPILRLGLIGDQNSTFSEHAHVAYQIKGNQEI